MLENFITDELRDYDNAKELFKNGKYEIYHLIDQNERLGFITLWHLDGFTFAEHFVIYEEYRNNGCGRQMLLSLEEIYPKIVLESELPIEHIQKRRISFYKRCGFFQNEQPYMQPSYRNGGNEVPLVIMSYPTPLNDFDSVVSQIHEKVYSKKLK